MKHRVLQWQGEPLTPELLLRLQRQAGNRAVVRLLHVLRIQADTPAQPVEPTPAKGKGKTSRDEHRNPSTLTRPAMPDNVATTHDKMPRDHSTEDSQPSAPDIAEISDTSMSPPRRHWLARLFWWLVWLLTFGLVDRRTGTLHRSGQGG